MTLIVRDANRRCLGTIGIARGKLAGSNPGVHGLVTAALRRTGSVRAAVRDLANFSNGYVTISDDRKMPAPPPGAEVKQLGTRVTGSSDGMLIKAVHRHGGHEVARWDPLKHPRDRHGRFIETGGRVRLLDGTLATVTRTLGGGKVEVRRDDGRLEDTTAHTVQVVKPGEAEGAAGVRLPKGRPLTVTHGPGDTPVIGHVTPGRDHLAVTTASGTVHYIPHQHVNRVIDGARGGQPARVLYTRPGFQPRADGEDEAELHPIAAGDLKPGVHAMLPHPETGRPEPGTVLRAERDGDRMEVDVRRADGTVDTADLSRHEQVDQITGGGAPDDHPERAVPETARPPAAVKPLPEGTAAARPVLYTYQRNAITSLSLDRDRTLPEPVLQAAARIRQRQPLSADQATALASHLRYDAAEAGGVTAARKRALERIATRLDAAAAEVHGHQPPRPSPLLSASRRVKPGDVTEGDTIAIQTSGGIITAKVHGIRSLMGGRIHEMDVEYGNGTRQVRAYTAKTPMWLLPDLPDDKPLPPASGPVLEHITPDQVRVGDTITRGGTLNAKVTAVSMEDPLTAKLSFDNGDTFHFRSYDGGPAVVRTARGEASRDQPWDSLLPAEHPEQARPADLKVGDRIEPGPGQWPGTIEHIEPTTGDDGTPGRLITLREDSSQSTTIYAADGEGPVTRLARADANAEQRIAAARQARQQAAHVASIRDHIDRMLAGARGDDLTAVAMSVTHPAPELMRRDLGRNSAQRDAQRALRTMVVDLVPNDVDIAHVEAVRKEAAARLEPVLAAMVQRHRDNLLTSLLNAGAGIDPASPTAEADVVAARRRVVEQFRSTPPPVDTGQVASALATAVTQMRAGDRTGPLPAPQVPVMPDAASVRDRMAGYRAVMPARSADIGKRTVTRAMYAPPRLEDLEAGKVPAVGQAVISIPDRAADGGPGEVAMRHLDIVNAAGRDLDTEMQRRLAARGLDSASVKARAAKRQQIREQKDALDKQAAKIKREARDSYARAHGFGSFSEIHQARWDFGRDRSKDAEMKAHIDGANELAVSKSAGLTAQADELFRQGGEMDTDPAHGAKAAVNALREAAMEVLNEARTDGLGGHGAKYRKATAGRAPLTEKAEAVKAMRWAEQHYPRSWLEKYDAHAPNGYGLGGVQRGHYNNFMREIRQSAAPVASDVKGAGKKGRVSVHEAGHAMEYSVPGIRELEDAYLWSRTSSGEIGSRTREARKWLGTGYGTAETSYLDEFPEPYSGKDYPRGGKDGLSDAYELLTTGIESLMAGSGYLDDGFRQWLLGTLALVD